MALDEKAIAEAAGHFADVWAELLLSLPDDYGCEMNCAEANAVADLYRALGDDATAASVIAAHGDHDVEGDQHWHGASTTTGKETVDG
jgi:hypothetical protein